MKKNSSIEYESFKFYYKLTATKNSNNIPDLLNGEFVGVTVQVLTGGGVSGGFLPPGGVPSTNWTYKTCTKIILHMSVYYW